MGMDSVAIERICAAEKENSVNGLLYDLERETLIDPTGFGLEDCLARKFRIPPTATPSGWLDPNSWIRIPRVAVKMYGKGYSLADPAKDVAFVIDACTFWHKKRASEPASERFELKYGAAAGSAYVEDWAMILKVPTQHLAPAPPALARTPRSADVIAY